MAKQYGFLDKRLGIITIYCNRKYGTNWYTMKDGKPEPMHGMEAFRSVSGGLKGLLLYSVTRGGTEGWKLALLLEGDDDQVYKFETGTGTVFARGMLWAIASMSPEQLDQEIGLNAVPAESSADSKFAASILYCNMFANGVDLPFFPGNIEVDWREIAQIALSKANRKDYPIDEIPDSSEFSDKAGNDSQRPAAQPRNMGQTGASPRPVGRSGVTYPNAPTAPTVAQQGPVDNVSGDYTKAMERIVKVYEANKQAVDWDRINKVLARNTASSFDQLPLGNKHQIVTTLAIELLAKVAPESESPAVKILPEILVSKPIDRFLLEQLHNQIESVFGEAIPF